MKIKLIDKDLPLPEYETNGSVGFDLLCRESVVIRPKEIALIPANIVVEVRLGWMLMITLRSSTPRKYGLIMPHGVGIIDNDYCGEDDEVMIQVYNFTEENTGVSRGDKIAQGILVHVGFAHWYQVDQMEEESRGGFGSTDN